MKVINVNINPNGVYVKYLTENYSTDFYADTLDEEALMNRIIQSEYPSSKAEAIMYNYLSNPKDAEVKKTFDAFQEYRLKAKAVVSDILEHLKGAQLQEGIGFYFEENDSQK